MENWAIALYIDKIYNKLSKLKNAPATKSGAFLWLEIFKNFKQIENS